MTFIDTHCHLYDEAFDGDRGEAVQRAAEAGVELMLLPDIDSQSTARLDALCESYPRRFRRMAGLHPTSVNADFERELEHVRSRLFASPAPMATASYVAVGEIGMDLYWDRTFIEEQQEALRRQMLWAQELDLPVALHVRKAHNEVFSLLRSLGLTAYRGVMHCFGGSVQEAFKAVEMGFYLGIGGVVTFKNATLAEVVKAVPLECLLLETDAPYLSPVPFRGKRNESSYLPLIAQKIADLKVIPLAEVAEQTTHNARSLFRLESSPGKD